MHKRVPLQGDELVRELRERERARRKAQLEAEQAAAAATTTTADAAGTPRAGDVKGMELGACSPLRRTSGALIRACACVTTVASSDADSDSEEEVFGPGKYDLTLGGMGGRSFFQQVDARCILA